MQTRSGDENSVCPSVCLSNAWFVTKWKKRLVQIFISYERSFSLIFWEEEWLVTGNPFYVKFWVNRPPLERNCRFSTNIRSWRLSWNTQQKSSTNTNRKSTTRFPMSLRWSSYVTPKSPKGGFENAKRPIFVKQSHFASRKSATKCPCVKTVSGRVVTHSLA